MKKLIDIHFSLLNNKQLFDDQLFVQVICDWLQKKKLKLLENMCVVLLQKEIK